MVQELQHASYTRADLADEKETRGLVPAVLDTHGRLDCLVNCAGASAIVPHADLAGATPTLWRRLYDLNVIAPWLLVTEAEPALRQSAEHGGAPSILNISSHAGVRPKGASIPYAVSKAVLNHMTRLLAVALAPAIRVNAIAPGLVETPMTAGWKDAHELWATRAPMRRAARPEDIADLAFSLISSRYITGEIALADGGLNLT